MKTKTRATYRAYMLAVGLLQRPIYQTDPEVRSLVDNCLAEIDIKNLLLAVFGDAGCLPPHETAEKEKKLPVSAFFSSGTPEMYYTRAHQMAGAGVWTVIYDMPGGVYGARTFAFREAFAALIEANDKDSETLFEMMWHAVKTLEPILFEANGKKWTFRPPTDCPFAEVEADVTPTGRTAGRGPSVQNIPKAGTGYEKAFTAGGGVPSRSIGLGPDGELITRVSVHERRPADGICGLWKVESYGPGLESHVEVRFKQAQQIACGLLPALPVEQISVALWDAFRDQKPYTFKTANAASNGEKEDTHTFTPPKQKPNDVKTPGRHSEKPWTYTELATGETSPAPYESAYDLLVERSGVPNVKNFAHEHLRRAYQNQTAITVASDAEDGDGLLTPPDLYDDGQTFLCQQCGKPYQYGAAKAALAGDEPDDPYKYRPLCFCSVACGESHVRRWGTSAPRVCAEIPAGGWHPPHGEVLFNPQPVVKPDA